MKLAAEHLMYTQLPSGLFIYAFDFETSDVRTSSDPVGAALVRQSFAAFALAEYAERFRHAGALEAVKRYLVKAVELSLPIGKPGLQSLLERAGVYDRWRLWKYLRGPLDRLGLLYSKQDDGLMLSPDKSYENAYPGATALALAAALKYQAASGDRQFEPVMRKWVRGLLVLNVAGRQFRMSPHQLAESGYVNGEAWLALAMYAETYPQDREVAEILQSLDGYLMTRYAGSSDKQFYHWGSLAAAQRASMSVDERFYEFLKGLNQAFFATRANELIMTENTCHVVEGLASFVHQAGLAGHADPLVTRANEWITRLMTKNLELQVISEIIVPEYSDDNYTERMKKRQGGFLRGTELPERVDITAHCLNALLIMERAGIRQ